ncbi:MAG: HAD-IA family hydrolase [Candidatus Gottesmanbacteria bacterium]|nr:HAD-IA family hydrolase [Candidatus Gottesmanbacteria bacterium]
MMKVLLFDLGNVVLTNDLPYHTPEQAKDFCEHFNVTLDNLDSAFNVSFPDFSLGRISEDEFWKRYLFTARAKEINVPYAKEFYRRNQAEMETMVSLLDDLKDTSRLAALSTIPKEWLAFKRDKFKLDRYFEIIISSGEYGVSKPDPRIYEIAIQRLHVEPREVLFVDDMELMLTPAREIGMETILFRGQEDLLMRLRYHDPELALPKRSRK